MKTTRDKLLNELDNVHWTIMLQLADDCDERGEITEAKGWRWLANNKRWPMSAKRKGSGLLYNWSYIYDGEVSNSYYYMGIVINHMRQKSQDIPVAITKFGILTRPPYAYLSSILKITAQSAGLWIADCEKNNRQIPNI